MAEGEDEKKGALVPLTESRAGMAVPGRRPSPAEVYLSRLAGGESRRTMAAALERLARIATGNAQGALACPWHLLRYEHTQAIRARLAEAYAPATANKHLAALRGVLLEAWRLGLMSEEERARASDLQRVRGSRLPAGRHVGDAEADAMMGSCAADDSPRGARAAAILALGLGGGLRRAEIAGVRLEDYDPTTGDLRVRGKGDKERMVPLGADVRAHLARWLELRGGAPGPLLCRLKRGGQVVLAPISGRVVHRTLRTLGATPHDLRRTFIGNGLDGGADLATMQALAGHASPTTTARYDRRGEEPKRRATERVRVPRRPKP